MRIYYINGALLIFNLAPLYFFIQHLTRKKDKTEFAMKTWKTGSHQNHLITKTLDALALDPTQTDGEKEERDKMRAKKREESKQAQALALQIASHIDTLGLEKPKVQNG